MRVAAIGEIVLEVHLPATEREGRLGGISVNFACAARRAGADVALYAPLGSDNRGRLLAEALARRDIERRVRVLSGSSALQRIQLAGDGERIFCGFEPGVLTGYRLTDAELAELPGFDVLALSCSPELAGVFAQVMALDPGARTRRVADFSQDSPGGDPAHPETWLAPHVDRLAVAFVGGQPTFLEPLARLSATTDAVLVLTVGARGAYALQRGRVVHQPSVARTIVDTTGCGDAFQGAFTAAYFGGAGLEVALARAAESAAEVAARVGGCPDL